MRSDVSWVPAAALGATLLCTAAVVINWRAPAPAPARVEPRPPELTAHGPRIARAPAAVLHTEAAAPTDLDREIAKLSARPPRYLEPLRARFVSAEDLYGFMQELLPAAEAGERAAQFYLYLTVGQCQMYLRLDPDGAAAVAERMMLLLNDRPPEERVAWQNDYRRCRGFAGGDLGPLKAAMGSDLPGAESEYASIWFQRAANAGHPPALAEGALRINTLGDRERIAMLEEAVAGGDAEVYWMLFYHSPGDLPGTVTPAGFAWLLLACRAGWDCARNADWFRGSMCLQEGEDCATGESALEHYWYRLPAHEREGAWQFAERIERDRLVGRLAEMPWPDLGRRNIVELRASEGLDTQ